MNDVLPQSRVGDLILKAHRLCGLLVDLKAIQPTLAEIQDLLDEASDGHDFAGCMHAIKGKLWRVNRELNRSKSAARDAGQYEVLAGLESAHALSKQLGQDLFVT